MPKKHTLKLIVLERKTIKVSEENINELKTRTMLNYIDD